MKRGKEWFDEWFNSPYYHILYKHRDHDEAQNFIDQLSGVLNFKAGQKICDLACGKGRHSIYLNSLGLDVTGLDLSQENIDAANKSSNDNLRFIQHDMRLPFADNEFDYVVNLFTSFGYFKTDDEDQSVIDAVYKALKPGGQFILDFLNPYTIINNLTPKESKEIDGIRFDIEKSFEADSCVIIKDIKITDGQKTAEYEERVKAIRRIEFLDHFRKAGFILKEVWGDHDLGDYEAEKSERMIFLLEK
ncbi:class I SAM-dependent methyltransferase [Marinigracilibium pacificum]|uniref:Class I SAM-dependent methyltransferase n=1 Tax=Marinigracilibium pacificum TaxID=2729599 RepID=A0A848J5K1_9BACT|nr:class I SAM-dependent methyltransferase [Marinigracilibium pacificum]NMM49744.1 class I SAM-dependent methyltransferase [Marinigracilibium pacificum]